MAKKSILEREGMELWKFLEGKRIVGMNWGPEGVDLLLDDGSELELYGMTSRRKDAKPGVLAWVCLSADVIQAIRNSGIIVEEEGDEAEAAAEREGEGA